jgi:hypothetical protein
MHRVSVFLEENGPQTTKSVETEVRGKATYIRKALAALEGDGFVSSAPGPRNAVVYEFMKPYREDVS